MAQGWERPCVAIFEKRVRSELLLFRLPICAFLQLGGPPVRAVPGGFPGRSCREYFIPLSGWVFPQKDYSAQMNLCRLSRGADTDLGCFQFCQYFLEKLARLRFLSIFECLCGGLSFLGLGFFQPGFFPLFFFCRFLFFVVARRFFLYLVLGPLVVCLIVCSRELPFISCPWMDWSLVLKLFFASLRNTTTLKQHIELLGTSGKKDYLDSAFELSFVCPFPPPLSPIFRGSS